MFVSVLTFGQIGKNDSYKLIVTLEKAPFDSLFVHEYTDGRNILFPGYKTGEFTWTFDIPDFF